jgi:hypothetical protein
MIIMRIPQQVPERVKEAPAQALRAVFSGIGQVLLVADRIRSRAAEPTRAQPASTERRGPGAPAATKDETRWRSLDETGNVRLLSEEDAAQAAGPIADTEPSAHAEASAVAEPSAATEAAAVAEPSVATESPAEPADIAEPDSVVRAEAGAGPGPASLPVPNYDDLSVASLRARLRNLDSAQVRALLDYEKSNAARAAVLTMFERRIVKLESPQA